MGSCSKNVAPNILSVVRHYCFFLPFVLFVDIYPFRREHTRFRDTEISCFSFCLFKHTWATTARARQRQAAPGGSGRASCVVGISRTSQTYAREGASGQRTTGGAGHAGARPAAAGRTDAAALLGTAHAEPGLATSGQSGQKHKTSAGDAGSRGSGDTRGGEAAAEDGGEGSAGVGAGRSKQTGGTQVLC